MEPAGSRGRGALCIGAVGWTASPVQALPPWSWTKVYYSDPDFQNPVGEETLLCNGSRYRDGTTSGYSLRVVAESCSMPPVDDRRECYRWLQQTRTWSPITAPELGCFG